MANGARWSIAMLVQVVAGIIAIWPRGGLGDASAPTASAGSSSTASSPEEDVDLALLREYAALPLSEP